MAPEYYIFTGRDGVRRIPDHVTHVLIDEALKFVPAEAFYKHPNIQEVICHDGVLKIEQGAFYKCYRLRRVIMPGVKIIKFRAFIRCTALTSVVCGRLERIVDFAFFSCKSLSSINLPSTKIVGVAAFGGCIKLTNVKFGKRLQFLEKKAFVNCESLERITLPLKVE